jgi:hypothetical protein
MPNVRSITLLVAFCAWCCSGPVAQFAESRPTSHLTVQTPNRIEGIIERVKRAQTATMVSAPYRIARSYRVFPTNNERKVWEVVAEVVFRPPNQKSYTIRKSSGNSHVDEAVRQILEREVEASAQGRQIPTAALLEGNYQTIYLGESEVEGHRCYRIGLTPMRIDKNLVVGDAWVDQQSFLVRKVEGDMVRSPSWWVKKVHVTFVFGDLAGDWIQTSSKSVADIRIFGSHTMESKTLPAGTAMLR